MPTARYVYWQHDKFWLGCFEEFPDSMTQGKTLNNLQKQLQSLYQDLTSGSIPGIRRIAELTVGQ